MIREPEHHHHLWFFQDHRWAVAGAAVLYALAIALFVVMAVDRTALQPIDDWWYDQMIAVETGWLTGLAHLMDIVGSAVFTWPLRFGVGVLLAVRRFRVLLGYWIAVALVSEIAIGVLKAAYDRPRPVMSLVETSGASFPSGHAIAASATAVALVIVVLAPGTERRVWEMRAWTFAVVMAMSRPYLRAHWLTDVVAGLLLGAATALALAGVADAIRARRQRTPDGSRPARAGGVPQSPESDQRSPG